MRTLCVLGCLLLATPAWSQARGPSSTQTVRYSLPRGLEARVLWTRGDVTIYDARGHHDAATGERLTRGLRVRTGRDGAAELALRNGTTLELSARTQLVMFAPPVEDPPDRPPSTTTSLRTGAVRFHANPETMASARVIPVATSAAIVYLGRGDGVLKADEGGHMTRLAVHRGRVSVTTRHGSFVVRANRGAVQRGVQQPRPTLPLPAQPRWVVAPPERVVSAGGPVTVSAVFALPRGRPEQWRVDVARDASFRDVVSTVAMSGSADLWLLESLLPGRYFVRVRALDEDGLEGPPSPTASLAVAAPEVVRGVAGRAAAVVMPAGFYCGLDGMLLAPADTPLRLEPTRSHSLRCAPGADGRRAQEFTLDADAAGALLHDVRLYTGPTGAGVLGLTLRGLDGVPISYADVDIEPGADLAVEAVREAERRGEYSALVRWAPGATRARLRVTVNRAARFEAEVTRPVN